MERKRGRKPGKSDRGTLNKKWLCYLLASTFDEASDLPRQHDEAFELVGKPFGLSAKSVGRYSLMARKQLATAEGEREYHDWLNKRERMWWFYQALHVEKRKLNLQNYVGEMDGDTLVLTRGDLPFSPTQAEALVIEAQRRRAEDEMGNQDYLSWLGTYNSRDANAKLTYRAWVPLPEHHPYAIAINENRDRQGLLSRIRGRGRRPKRLN